MYQFLYKHCRQVRAHVPCRCVEPAQEADEVRDEYADTIGKIHLTYYKTYLAKLLKFQARRRCAPPHADASAV